jgi:hypothetical protein
MRRSDSAKRHRVDSYLAKVFVTIKKKLIYLNESLQRGLEPTIAPVRAELCSQLQAIGVDARIGEGEEAQGKSGKGLKRFVEIAASPICRADVDMYLGSGDDPYRWIVTYWVPDFNRLTRLRVSSKLIKTGFISTRATGVNWESDLGDAWLESSLSNDTSIRASILNSGDEIKVETSPPQGGWRIGVYNARSEHNSLRSPTLVTRGRWICYEKIAKHILIAGLPREKGNG